MEIGKLKRHGVARDHHGAHGGNEGLGQNSPELEHTVFNAVWHADGEDLFDRGKLGAIPPGLFQVKRDHFLLHHPHQDHRGEDAHEGGGDGGTRRAQLEGEDQKRVTAHVDDVDHQGHQHGTEGVSRHTEEGACGVDHGKEGEGERDPEEIILGIVHHVRLHLAEEEGQKRSAEQQDQRGEQGCHEGCRPDELLRHVARAGMVSASVDLRHHHGAAHDEGVEKEDEQGVQGVDQGNTRNGGVADAGNHDRVHRSRDK